MPASGFRVAEGERGARGLVLRPVGSLVIPASQGSKNLSQNLSKKDSLSQDLVQPGTVEGSLAGGAGEGSLDLTRLQGADVLLTVSLATSDQVPERRGGQGRVKRAATHGGGGTALREKVDRSQSLF